MKVIVIDDERPALRAFEVLLQRYPEVDVLGFYVDSKEGIEAVGRLKPDAVFLDINMPRLHGMDAAAAIHDYNPDIQIVFVTAYNEYAIGAFEVDVCDYLLKPVDPQRLDKTIARLHTKLDKKCECAQKLVIRSFGYFEVGFLEREPIKWRAKKTKELFAFLLCHTGRGLPREEIIDALWRHDNPESASKQLYNGIYYIRKALAAYGIDRSLLSIDEKNYCLHLGDVDYDAKRFCELYKSRDDRLTALTQMESLYTDDFLAGQPYDWAIYERERLFELYLKCVAELSKLLMENKRSSEAEMLLKKAYFLNPFEEEITEMLLTHYLKKNNISAARQHYEAYCMLLKNELNSIPSERIRKLQANMVSL